MTDFKELWLKNMMKKLNTDEAGVRAYFSSYGKKSTTAGKPLDPEKAREMQRKSTEAKRKRKLDQTH